MGLLNVIIYVHERNKNRIPHVIFKYVKILTSLFQICSYKLISNKTISIPYLKLQ